MAEHHGYPAEWSLMARDIAAATDRGITAARSHDSEDLDDAVAQLEKHGDAARGMQAHMVRELLETSYQDGLSGDDVSDVLTRTIAAAARWVASVDPNAVAAVLTGALGVAERPGDSDIAAQPIPIAKIIGAALLVLADLAADAEVDHNPYLVRAVEEIRREQTIEIP
ncbi:hypothetical protein AAFP35_11715 [Gordonia sp. CPCC 206044]|uniref:hypothetical protein n=1 Tax=Gordonia sp. CPCC 206044 TaxID=3140793 RepID=UPI003AF3E88E